VVYIPVYESHEHLPRRPADRSVGPARRRGVSRAEVIRRLLDRALGSADADLAADLSAIDDSFGALAELDVPARAADDREDHLARMWRVSA
jgi:hypothetical protein